MFYAIMTLLTIAWLLWAAVSGNAAEEEEEELRPVTCPPHAPARKYPHLTVIHAAAPAQSDAPGHCAG